jgi:hypothetical protein
MTLSVSPFLKGINAEDSFVLTVKPGCGFNELSWTAVTGADRYWIYRGPGPGQEASQPLTDFPVKELVFHDDINIENGNQYCYFVTAVNANAEEFKRSNEACATPKCFERDECKLELKYQVDNRNYWANGVQKGPMEAAPMIKWNRTLLLIKYLTNEIKGTKLDWDGNTRTVKITTRDGHIIILQIGNKTATVDGKKVQIDPNNPAVTPIIVNGRTLIPFRFAAENLGATGPDDIKWFGDTRTIVLYFADPDCDECDWIKGNIVSVSPITATVAAITGLKVEFRSCTGQTLTYVATSDLKDSSGKYPISQYRGCAELCVVKGQVKQWKAYPDEKNCCGQTECKELKGKILKVTPVLFGSTKRWVVVFDDCPIDGKTLEFVVDTELKDPSGIQIDQYTGCAIICVSAEKKIVEWKAIRGEACCEEAECKWLLVRIEKVEMPPATTAAAPATVYAKPCIDGKEADTVKYLAPYGLADENKKIPIGRYTGCAKICVDANNKIVRWYALPDLKECCQGTTEPCDWVRVKINGFKAISDTIWMVSVTWCNEGNPKDVTYLVKSNLTDENKKHAILKYTGCAKLCIKDGEIIKWIAYPDMKDCCPGQDECRKIRGVIKKVFYNEDGKRWVIAFEPCNPNDMKEPYAASDLLDESGKFPLSQYTGCAEICLKERFIVSWKALPDEECCPKPKECNLVLGEIQYTKYLENEKRWVVVFKPCGTEKLLELFSEKDLLDSTGKFPLSQYKGCAELCIRERTVVSWTALPDRKCCEEPVDCKWVKGRIVRTAYNEEMKKWVVYFDDCPESEVKKYLLDGDMVDETGVFPISQYRGCAKVCLDGETIVKWIAYPDVKDCCPQEQPPEIKLCITLEKVNCEGNPPSATGKDENGTTWNLVLTPEICRKYANYLVSGKCLVVVGYEKTRVTTNSKTMVVTAVRPTECPCKPDEENCTWHKGVVMHIYSGEGVPADKGAKFMMFFWECVDYAGAGGRLYYFREDLADVTGRYKLSTYRGCAEVCLDANNFIVKWKVIDTQECCPPPTRVGRCVNVEGIDCNADPPRFWGKTTWPGELCVVMVTKEQCQQLKVGQCFWVFGKILTPPAGAGFTIAIGAESMQPASPCPCPQPTVVDVCIKVERTECKPGQLSYVWGFDGNGEPWWLLVNYDLCSRMTPGTCWKVKGWGGRMANGVNEMENVSAEPTDCSCVKPVEKPKCICITIKEKDCDKFTIVGVDGNGKRYLLYFPKNRTFSAMCQSLEVGASYEVCYTEKTDNTLLVETIRRVKACPPAECKTVKGKITKTIYNEGTKRWVVLFMQCGYEKEQEFFAEKDLLDSTGKFPISQYMGCAELCIRERMIVKWTALPNEECCPTDDKCKTIKGKITKTFFNERTKSWVVVFMQCGYEKEQEFFCEIDLKDPTGKYRISEYTGCAELCIRERMVIKWKALPNEECCPETDDCDWIKGRLQKTQYDEGSKVWVIFFDDCPIDNAKRYTTSIDLIDGSGVFPISQYSGCAKLCVKDGKIIKWIALPDVRDCCVDQPKEEIVKDCVCFKVAEINCDAKVGVLIDDAGKRWKIGFDNSEICKDIKPGDCIKLCYFKKVGGTQIVLLPDFQLIINGCSCTGGPELVTICVKVLEINCDLDIPKLTVNQVGKDKIWTVYLPNRELCGTIKEGSCWIITGFLTGDNAIKVNAIRPDPDCNCEPEPDDRCFCITVKTVEKSCGNGRVYVEDENGRKLLLVLPADLAPLCEKIEPKTCWTVCGAFAPKTDSVWIQVNVTKLEPKDCPCGVPPTKERCVCVKITSLLCEQNFANGADAAGVQWNLILKNTDLCKSLKLNAYYEVCGEILSTNPPTMSVESVKPVDGPCPQQPICMCVTLRSKECSTDQPKAYVVNEDGRSITVYLKSPEACGKLEPGKCYRICGNYEQLATGEVIFRSTSWENVPCPCAKPEENCWCIQIREFECSNDPKVIFVKAGDGKMYMLQAPNEEMCKMLKVGACYKVCGTKITNDNTSWVTIKVTTIENRDCPCPTEEPKTYTMDVKVKENHCWISPPRVVATEIKTGKQVDINIGKDGLCDLLVVGKCFRITANSAPTESGGVIKFTIVSATEIPCN